MESENLRNFSEYLNLPRGQAWMLSGSEILKEAR